ncbi:hypothetical protein niasHS_000381 [Heterodera schachtii]|uniref:Uncharacterized protein n=1 Tax=Heterodera schachtii TaxID=97005 RepID=A0ABD2K1F4_HETSC
MKCSAETIGSYAGRQAEVRRGKLSGFKAMLFSLNLAVCVLNGWEKAKKRRKGEEVTDKVCGARVRVNPGICGHFQGRWRTTRTQRSNRCECAGQKEPIVPNEESAEHKDKVPIDQRRTVPFLPSPIINLATQLKAINHKDTKSGLLKRQRFADSKPNSINGLNDWWTEDSIVTIVKGGQFSDRQTVSTVTARKIDCCDYK